MPAIPLAFIASVPAPDTLRNLRRVTRAIVCPPKDYEASTFRSRGESLGGYGTRDNLSPHADAATTGKQGYALRRRPFPNPRRPSGRWAAGPNAHFCGNQPVRFFMP